MEGKPRTTEYFLLLSTVAVLVMVYAPSLIVPYAKLDTFRIYANVYFGDFRTWTSWISIQGRPLASVLTQIFYSQADSIQDLRWIRLIGFTGTLATAASMLYCLKKQGMSPVPRLFLALWICTLPAMATFTVWTTCFTYPWAVAIAVIGGWLCVSAKDTRWFSSRHCTGASLIFISLWFYQPSGLFALIPLAFHITQLNGNWVDVCKRGLISCVWVNFPLPLYYVLYKGIFLRFMPYLEEFYADRLDHSENLVKQLQVVLGTAIPEAFSGWFYFVDPLLQNGIPILMTGIVLGGVFLSFRRKQPEIQFVKGSLLAGVILVSLIPVMYLSTGIPWPRMMGAFTGIVLVCLVVSLCLVFAGKWERVGKALLIGLLVLQLGAASYAINVYWVLQSKSEIEAYEKHISALQDRPQCLMLIDSERWYWAGRKIQYIYGNVSTQQMWVMEPMVRLLLAEKFGYEYGKSVPIFSSPVNIKVPYTHVIDANVVLFNQMVDPIRSDQQVNGFNGLYLLQYEDPMSIPGWWASPWYASTWFGIFRFNPEHPDTILHHAIFGDLQYGWDWEQGILHLNLPGMSWSTTTPDTFPLMKRSSDGIEFVVEARDDGTLKYTEK